jgi:hypothetical protein
MAFPYCCAGLIEQFQVHISVNISLQQSMKNSTQKWHNTVGTAVGCLLHFSLMGLIPSLLARVACKNEQLDNNNNNNNNNNMDKIGSKAWLKLENSFQKPLD